MNKTDDETRIIAKYAIEKARRQEDEIDNLTWGDYIKKSSRHHSLNKKS